MFPGLSRKMNNPVRKENASHENPGAPLLFPSGGKAPVSSQFIKPAWTMASRMSFPVGGVTGISGSRTTSSIRPSS